MSEDQKVLVVDFQCPVDRASGSKARFFRGGSPYATVAQLMAHKPAAIILSAARERICRRRLPRLILHSSTRAFRYSESATDFSALAAALGGEVACTGGSEYGRTLVGSAAYAVATA